ncbi:3-hydroxyacyl-CoA dehydrogenase NAD-binding domain-containing protein [Alphaproteobacteria bacterium]|nr:3-hydroxyacyl-CoA dehydrogenase NAD-binding domain-containing protein [Alphaproteobacteria bacterium]
MIMADYKHFQLAYDEKNICRLAIKVAGKSVNILMSEVMDELSDITKNLATNPPAGLILYSAMERGFIFGADINEFADLKTEADIAGHIKGVLASFARIEDMPCPTTILIDGICVGGGYELALSFDRIIAVKNAQIGFPEIKLGLLPGYGGSVRAYERMGLEHALGLVLSGKSIRAPEALAMGAIDHVVDERDHLMDAGLAVMKGEIERKPPMVCDDPSAVIAAETKNLSQRALVENTLAPFAVLEHYNIDEFHKNNMLNAETELFSKLMLTPASVGLRRVFQLNDMVKKGGRGNPEISHIHVIGAGVMGGDIAAVAAMSGFTVTLQDLNADAINAAIARANALFERRLKAPDKIAAATARLTADPVGEGLGDADLLIEAVAENLAIKQSVFGDAEGKMKPGSIMATNTSAIPLEQIGATLAHPERLIGMHFFNPVPVLPLVEIVYTDASNPVFVERAMYASGVMGKQPIKCKSAPGFLVNRALIPYIFKAIDDVLAGANPDKLDQAMVSYGMPMGPIELADQVGLDVCHDVGIVLGISKATQEKLQAMIAAGTIGRKSGSGFYQWPDKKADRPRADYDADELSSIANDLLAPLIKECKDAVREGVVDNADLADAACLFGLGYPAHTGGPLFWNDRMGGA